jgi:hypothetical protein
MTTQRLLGLLLASCLFTPGAAFATPPTESFELHLEVPNVAEAPNGDRVAVTGEGMFTVHPKSVSAHGTFTHSDSQGNVLGEGTWVATQLLDYQTYGAVWWRLQFLRRPFRRTSAAEHSECESS